MKMPEIEKHEALLIFIAWSLLIGCAAFVGGYKAAAPDCNTCESALSDAIDELHQRASSLGITDAKLGIF